MNEINPFGLVMVFTFSSLVQALIEYEMLFPCHLDAFNMSNYNYSSPQTQNISNRIIFSTLLPTIFSSLEILLCSKFIHWFCGSAYTQHVMVWSNGYMYYIYRQCEKPMRHLPAIEKEPWSPMFILFFTYMKCTIVLYHL